MSEPSRNVSCIVWSRTCMQHSFAALSPPLYEIERSISSNLWKLIRLPLYLLRYMKSNVLSPSICENCSILSLMEATSASLQLQRRRERDVFPILVSFRRAIACLGNFSILFCGLHSEFSTFFCFNSVQALVCICLFCICNFTITI